MIHVLLVEDIEDQAELLRTQLRIVGGDAFDVHWASNLTDALRILDECVFDVVLLDLTLPESRGLDTFKRVYGRIPGTPIVILSALRDEQVEMAAIHEGAQDYLVKGATPVEIIKAIFKAIERHSYRLTGKALETARIALRVLRNNRRAFRAMDKQTLSREIRYILDSRAQVFHCAECQRVRAIPSEERVYFQWRETAEREGFGIAECCKETK